LQSAESPFIMMGRSAPLTRGTSSVQFSSPYASDTRRIHQLVDRLQQRMALYGYETLDTPIIQAADLFLTRAGDQIINKLFTFERRGQQLALRPEFTASAAYDYVERGLTGVVRWQYSGPIFEDDPDDIAHHYQHVSIGAELIGMAGPDAEAEIMAMAAEGLAAEGIANWRLVIGHIGLIRRILARFDLDSRTQRFLLNHLPTLKAQGRATMLEQLDRLLLGGRAQTEQPLLIEGIDASSELNAQQIFDVVLDATQRGVAMGGRTRQDIVRRLIQKRQRASEREQIVAALDFLERWVDIQAAPQEAFAAVERLLAKDEAELVAQWAEAVHLLQAYGIPESRIQIQPGLARSWDYYTGIVFELRAQLDDGVESGLHLGGGGRYDELAHLVGAEHDVPAVGFAYYGDELLAALPAQRRGNGSKVILSAAANARTQAARWASELRHRGIAVVLASSNDPGSLMVEADGNIQLSQKQYSPAEVDALVKDLGHE
jgi:histidyl-tRNA synthetase